MESHLDADQIEEILGFASDPKDQQALNHVDDDAMIHIKTCGICQSKVAAAKAAMELLSQLEFRSYEASGPHCPPDNIWIEIMGGMMKDDLERHYDHAAQCDHCGPLLRQAVADQAVADFTSALTPEEEVQIASLRSSSAQWQHSMVERIAQSNPGRLAEQPNSESGRFFPTDRRPTRRRYWLVAQTAFAVILVAAVLWLWRSHQPSHSSSVPDLASVNRLLAQSYSEQRTLPLRFPGADYAKPMLTRGPRESDLDRPIVLLQAETAIQENLRNSPEDAGWLDARGRADLLQWNFLPAIKTLERAAAVSPDSTAIQLDLAMAYFESSRSVNESGYQRSTQMLAVLHTKEPKDPIVLFNLALSCQAGGDPVSAKQYWEQYLRLDPTGAWSDEAREHLAETIRTIDGRSLRDSQPLLNQQQFEARITTTQEQTWNAVDPRIEDYLEKALLQWVPDSNASRSQHFSSITSGYNDVKTLGVILERRHRDDFLLDLLRGISKPGFPAALESLRKSILANKAGNEDFALHKAQESESLFRGLDNEAGVLQARFEQAYARQFLMNASKCSGISNSSYTSAVSHGYSWLATQFSLEEAFCSNIVGDPANARFFAIRAAEQAKNAHYDDLYLRSMVGIAAMDSESGSMLDAWRLTSEGLQIFWSGQGSPIRGYSFYVLQDALAETDQLWAFDTIVIGEGLHLLPQVRDPEAEVAIRYRSAEADMRNGESQLAEQELHIAQKVLAAAPKTNAVAHERLTGTIEMAKVENEQGRPTRSIELLQQATEATQVDYEIFDTLEYFITLGESSLKLGHPQDATAAFLLAIKTCERGVNTLRSPRDRLSWIRACRVPYYSLAELQFKSGAPDDAFRTYQRFRQTSMNTLSAADRSESAAPKRENSSVSYGQREEKVKNAISDPRNASVSDVGVVTYAVFDDGVLVWTHDNRRSRAHWVEIGRSELIRLAKRFLAECEESTSASDRSRHDAATLYEWLIAPIRGDLGSSNQLIIEPDSPVSNIPFEALLDPAGRYFGERFSLQISPGGIRAHSPSSIPSVVNQPALIVNTGYSDTLNGIMPLEDTNEEVRRISGILRNPSVLTGSAATRSAVERYLPRMAIFHYVGHSQIDRDSNSLLLMNDDQRDRQGRPVVFWGAANIKPALFRRCQLVVLSACSTANGQQGEWLDRDSLVFALVSAGVPNIIASHWNVDSNATSVMMEAFYRHLRDGGNVPIALQAAQAEVRKNPATSSPYYWAGFSVYGMQ